MIKSEATIAKIKKNITENNVNSVIAKCILKHLWTITKITENDFVNNCFISQQMFNEFFKKNDLANFSELITNINSYLKSSTVKKISNSPVSLHFFYNDMFNNLDRNFQDINSQEITLEKIIEKTKESNHLYFFINEKDKALINDFALNLKNLGFKVDIFFDFLKMQEKSLNINKKDLIFYIFDDYKNRQLFSIALQFQNKQKQIIICKKDHHQAQALQSLKYEINYQHFRNSLVIDTRKIILTLTLEIIFQKIAQEIQLNYETISSQFDD